MQCKLSNWYNFDDIVAINDANNDWCDKMMLSNCQKQYVKECKKFDC